jgi:hypothetical protein
LILFVSAMTSSLCSSPRFVWLNLQEHTTRDDELVLSIYMRKKYRHNVMRYVTHVTS